ncbi:MAG: glutathione peroxidase [Lachnospirales bacterium]
MGFYDLKARKMNGEEVSMGDYKGKVVLIVNTASKCGLTPQFEELEELYKKYHENGLEILGFPCSQFANQELENNDEIHSFCQRNYGVTFTMFEKIDVNGDNTHEIYKFLKSEKGGVLGEKIKWNFAKFIVDKNGTVNKRYAPIVKPNKLENDIVSLLK